MMPIIVECDVCAKKFKFADSHAGKTVSCKECGASIDIPGSASGDEEEARPLPRSSATMRARRLSDDELPAPRSSATMRTHKGGGKRGKKSSENNPLMMLAVGGGVLLAIVVVGAVFFSGGGGTPNGGVALNEPPPHMVGGTAVSPPVVNTPSVTSSSTGTEPSNTGAATPGAGQTSTNTTLPAGTKNTVAAVPSTKGTGAKVPEEKPKPVVVEVLPPVKWTATADPPAEPITSEWNDSFQIPIPSRRIDRGNIVYPTTPSPFVILGSNENDKESRELWNLATGKKVFTLKGVEFYSSEKLTLSADAHYFAWGGATGQIDVYDLKAKKPLRKIIAGDQKDKFYVSELALAPGDRLVAHASVQKEFKVWQLPEGKLLFTIHLGKDYGYPERSAYSPGGKYVAVEADHLARTIHLYDLESGELVGELPTKRVGVVIALSELAFSPDGTELACVLDESGSKSTTQIVIWSMADGKVKDNVVVTPGIKDKFDPDLRAQGLQWFPDGQHFLVHGMALVSRATGQVVYTLDKPQVGDRSMRRVLGNSLLASFDGDRTGGTLQPISITAEELGRAATVAEAGGLPEDLKLPPLTKTDLAGAASPAAATGWSADADPAPTMPATVLATPLAFQAGKGTPRSLHLVGGAAPKAFVRVADGENTNDVKLNFPDTDIRYEDGQIITRTRPRPIVCKENWIDYYDLAAKKPAGKLSVPFSGELVSVSPDGSRALLQAHNAKGRLDVYDVADSKHLVGFRPYQSVEDENDWPLDAALLLNAEHLLTLNIARTLTVWKVPECQPIFSLAKTVLPVVSPGGKFLACATSQGVEIRDALTGAGRGVIALQGVVRALAFHPQGDRLAILLQDKGGAYLFVADMKTGTLGEEIPSPINTDKLQWCGDQYLLCNQTALLDLSAKTVAWSYKLTGGIAAATSPDGRFWYAAPKSPRVPALQLVAATLPEPKLVAELAKVKLEPQLVAQPGSTVQLKTQIAPVAWAPSLAGALPAALAKAVERSGVTIVESNQPLKITVTGVGQTGKPFELSQMGNRTNVTTIQNHEYELKVVYTSGAEVLWQDALKLSAMTSTNLITHVPPGQTAQQVIDEAMAKRIEYYCDGLVVPGYVFSKKSVEGLGSSTLGGDGPVTGGVKK